MINVIVNVYSEVFLLHRLIFSNKDKVMNNFVLATLLFVAQCIVKSSANTCRIIILFHMTWERQSDLEYVKVEMYHHSLCFFQCLVMHFNYKA